MRPILIVSASFCLLAACSGGSGNPFGGPSTLTRTHSIVQANPAGIFPTQLINPVGRSVSNGNGAAYAYQLGTLPNNTGITAQAGLTSNSSFKTTRPVTGTAVAMNGAYQLHTKTNPRLVNGAVQTDTQFSQGPIALTADFAANTLIGSAGSFAVAGTFNGTATGQGGLGALSGTTSYNGMNGDLTGFTGQDGAIGAFSGDGNNGVYAGGFIANAAP